MLSRFMTSTLRLGAPNRPFHSENRENCHTSLTARISCPSTSKSHLKFTELRTPFKIADSLPNELQNLSKLKSIPSRKALWESPFRALQKIELLLAMLKKSCASKSRLKHKVNPDFRWNFQHGFHSPNSPTISLPFAALMSGGSPPTLQLPWRWPGVRLFGP